MTRRSLAAVADDARRATAPFSSSHVQHGVRGSAFRVVWECGVEAEYWAWSWGVVLYASDRVRMEHADDIDAIAEFVREHSSVRA